MMALAFVANGLGVFGIRVLAGWGLAQSHTFTYLAIWYWSGFLLAAAICFCRFTGVYRREILIAGLMGACSVSGQMSMLTALGNGAPGYVLFPVCIGGGIVLVAVVGILLFRERVRTIGIVGIIVGTIGAVLLAFA
jgi:multidrug transporter EmrE-like cation transporter